MSETLPSQQNETQPWKRELPLHREVSGTLNPEETLALMGSWAERDLAGLDEIYEPGTKDYTRQEAVYGAALEQLAGLRAEKGDSMNDTMDALYSRQQELKDALRRSDNQADNIRIGTQLAGIKLLDDMRFRITDQVDLSAEVIGSKSSPRDRATAINEMIAEHNEWAARDSESITDSPEIREAQERINARYAEQAKQPQPTETVDDARQKVAEAFGDTGERERQAFIGEVVRAAKGSARIHTSVTKETKLRFKGREDTAYNDGFSDFGEGLDWGTHNWRENGAFLSDTSEAFIFEPATTTRKKTVTETIETGGRFRKKTEQVQKEVADGEAPIMIVNPATGQQEPGVNVRYQFDGNTSNKAWSSRSLEKNDLPKYEAPDNNRGGNQLFIEVVLPKSVADTLQQAALRSPDMARQFAQSILAENGATEATVKMPPYTELPVDWTMTVATLQKDTFSDRGRIYTLRNIANRQDVKV